MSSQIVANQILEDPFLINLFKNDTLDDRDLNRDMNWIKIQTSYVKEDGKESSISLLSVKTYTGPESNNIFKSIKDSNDIIFTNEGHVGVDFKTATDKTSARYFYVNPTAKNFSGGIINGFKSTGIENTVKARNPGFEATFLHDEKILFSQNLKWILYALPDRKYILSTDGTWKITQDILKKDTVPIYVLLYNPIHRKVFQSVYANIINQDSTTSFSSQQLLQSSSTSFDAVIKKYCNAFRVKKMKFNDKTLTSYADPSCALALNAMNGDIAKLSQILSMNLTVDSWKNDFYQGGMAGYTKAMSNSKFIAVSKNDSYCGRGSGNGPSRFLKDKAKVIRTNNTAESFMQILTNNQIGGTTDAAAPPSGWNPNKPGDTTTGFACKVKALSFVDCSISLSMGGDVQLDQNNINNVCGNAAPATTEDITLDKVESPTSTVATPTSTVATPVSDPATPIIPELTQPVNTSIIEVPVPPTTPNTVSPSATTTSYATQPPAQPPPQALAPEPDFMPYILVGAAFLFLIILALVLFLII